MGSGGGVLYLFTTAVHSGLLGAFITLAGVVWYPEYLGTTQSWGLTPLEDQQLGGLIMGVVGAAVYVAVNLYALARWLMVPERQRS